jgi:Family of unknown function (DUF6502)
MKASAKAHLVYSFRRVMRPLVKILIRAGVTYDEFREVVKGTFVEVAVRDGVGKGVPVTRARVSGATGVPLHDVNRYVDDESLLAPPGPTNAAIIAEVLHLWSTDTKYIGPYGIPLELDFDTTPGRNLCELINRADSMADPEVIVAELVETGIVVGIGSTHFRTTARALVLADELSPQMLEHMGNSLTNLANTLQFNMRGPTMPKRIERTVFPGNGIDRDLLPRFEAYADERMKAFLRDVDDWLSKNGTHVLDESSAIQTGITVFHYLNEYAPYQHLKDVVREVAESPDA